jgi:hypothetical protein
MTRGWFTEARLVLGQAGIHILEFGLVDLTCHSDLVLESAGSEVLAGAGLIGDSIGTADIQFMGGAGISPAAPRSTTGAISTEVVGFVAEFIAEASKPAVVLPHEVESTTAQEQFLDLSMGIGRLPEDMRRPAVKVACAPVPSVALIMEARRGASRRADSPASVAECAAVAEVTAAAVGGSPNFPLVD